MQRKEISAKLDGIIDFAGVRDFIDVPVKRYSSGMVVRLGFSVAAHLDPDILLLDEVLAVGDAAFQKKCLDRVLELKRRSTVVFISHDLTAVQQLCDRVIVMNQGEIVYDGATAGAMTAYSALARFRSSPPPSSAAIAKTAEVVSLEFLDSKGRAGPHGKDGRRRAHPSGVYGSDSDTSGQFQCLLLRGRWHLALPICYSVYG